MAEETFLSPELFADTYEPVSMKPGEYQLRILNATLETQKKEPYGKYLSFALEIPSEPKSKNIYHVMMLPTTKDDEKKANNRKLAMLNFFKAFDIDVSSGLNLQACIGRTGWAILEEEDDPEYGTRNRLKKVVLPK